MLYRFAVKELSAGAIQRRFGHTVVVMQYYPRFVGRDLIDEYCRNLAPAKDLFTEFKALERSLKDHDRAFEQIHYEERFSLSPEGVSDLQRLSALSAARDVYLICQCLALQRCHADLLLLAARHLFQAGVQWPRQTYDVFSNRLKAGQF